METDVLLPGAVEIDLGEFRLIPGPKGDTGERGPRGYGIESAVLNPDYTLTLKFENGNSYTTPSIRGEAAAEVEEVRLEKGEYQGSYTDLLIVEMSDERRFEFEIYNRAAEYYDKAEAAKNAAETARSGAESAKDAAEAAKSGAVTAREAAESARDEAKASEDAARESETAAAESDADAREAQSAAEEAQRLSEAARDAAEGFRDEAGVSAESAKYYSGKPPVIREGRWWTWDAEAQDYVDTGEPARGNLMYAAFRVDETTGDLYMVTDGEYTGPGFRLAGNDLEVVLHG